VTLGREHRRPDVTAVELNAYAYAKTEVIAGILARARAARAS
jgi:hypothetical protein